MLFRSDNLVKVRVCMIRKKARRYGCPGDPIETLWGSGYALSEVGRDWLQQKLTEPFTTPPNTGTGVGVDNASGDPTCPLKPTTASQTTSGSQS